MFLWERGLQHLETGELIGLLAAVVATTLLVPPTRNAAETVLDRYVYRARASFRDTVRQASQTFTRVLDLRTLVHYVQNLIRGATNAEGVVIYVKNHLDEIRLPAKHQEHSPSEIERPLALPASVLSTLVATRDCIVRDELLTRNPAHRHLHDELTRLNWAVVLPLLFEDAVIGAIVVGPKLSGDAFYPHDLDLLMTLANQAGIAIKNAQLYTEVLLANEYIENIVATIESGVVAVNSAGRVTRFNRAAAHLTGRAAPGVLGEPVDALPEALAGPLRDTLVDGRQRTEPEIPLPDGTVTRDVICTTSPLRDPDGGILGAVAVFSDLTPLKELEAERRRVERLAYFEILASSIAHEIKNPVVAIKTFAQLIPRRRHDDRFVDEFSRVVTREVGRMERLVERLRTLSRPADRPKHRLDVRGPLSDAVEFLRPAFDEKRIRLGVVLGAEPRHVVGDAGELEQLFINLLMNACEATPPDGLVTVDITGSAEHAIVAVADSGPGFPPELIDRAFDPFVTTKPRGFGLGLTISAGIAATHRAKLRAANRPAGGALLTVEFPAAAPVEAAVRA